MSTKLQVEAREAKRVAKAKKAEVSKSPNNVIKSKKEASQVGLVYTTSNFDIFQRMKFNRGEDKAVDEKRVAGFQKLLDEGLYFKGICHVLVNLKFIVIDGTSKLEMHRRNNLPVNFIITDQKEFNEGTDIEILAAMSRYNAKSSKWDGSANFNAAFKCKEELALAIDALKSKAEKDYGFVKNLLTPSRIYALITKDAKGLAGDSKEISAYCRKELVSVIESNDFKREMEFVNAVLKFVLDWNSTQTGITPFYVIRAIMPYVWANEMNMEKMYHQLIKYKFPTNIKNRVAHITTYIKHIYDIPLKRNEILIGW